MNSAFSEQAYDIIVPVVKKNIIFFLQNALPEVHKNLRPRKVILVGSKDLAGIPDKYGCEFADEDKIVAGLTLANVRAMIAERGGIVNRAGWYFQQFLKMGWARVTQQPYYLVWDADSIPVKKIAFFDNAGHIFFNKKTEHHAPYFETINILFSGKVKKQINGSFISEHMMMDRTAMIEMLDEIEQNKDTGDFPFYQKIINAISSDALSHSGFSEFETYGNWVALHYPGKYLLRPLKSMRQGGVFIGTHPSKHQLEGCACFYDMISCEMLDQKRVNVSLFMPFVTKILLFFGIPLPRIIACFNELKLFYYHKIRRQEILIVE